MGGTGGAERKRRSRIRNPNEYFIHGGTIPVWTGRLTPPVSSSSRLFKVRDRGK